MDFLSGVDQVILVGNHARSLVSSEVFQNLNSIIYEPGGIAEGSGGFIRDSKKSNPIPCESYTLESLADAIDLSIDHAAKNILIGDPSEWIAAASITQCMHAKSLAAVFFVYPVGMAALDSRKELAQLILTLKMNEVPTYLIRDPELFFEGIEPNQPWLVNQLKDGICGGKSIEYLCGLAQASEAN
ncbi:MAG: hypothetical protein ACKO4Y_01725 [Flavobacteriales bacterium]